MIKRGLTLVNAQHITASVFINDDESGLHHDYEVWLERLAPHTPIEQYWHNRTGQACLRQASVLNELTGTPTPREAGVDEDYREVLGAFGVRAPGRVH